MGRVPAGSGNPSSAANRLVSVAYRYSGVADEFGIPDAVRYSAARSQISFIEDFTMAVSKKSLINSTPAAKTPKTKSEKTSAATPAAPSKMKTTVKYI